MSGRVARGDGKGVSNAPLVENGLMNKVSTQRLPLP